MDPFYQNISSFPTAFFTFFLLITVLFWLVAVLGFVDIDILDFDSAGGSGALTVNQDGALSSPEVLAGLLLRFGLQGVPLTVIISLVSLVGWLLCYYAVHFFFGAIAGGLLRFIVGFIVLLVALYLAVIGTALLIKPLRPLFKSAQQGTAKSMLGKTVLVRTSRVDRDFGEATLEDGGAGLVLKIRADGENTFSKSERVVLLEYIEEKNVYRVISEKEFLGQ
ncbi:DUF1449 domain-containing protein [Gammaproteobacteria bacterium 53_120_T64]|nr:DUF1449 domain-containing protein [Gammaproteobacteria bacterium 53_120_T64]